MCVVSIFLEYIMKSFLALLVLLVLIVSCSPPVPAGDAVGNAPATDNTAKKYDVVVNASLPFYAHKLSGTSPATDSFSTVYDGVSSGTYKFEDGEYVVNCGSGSNWATAGTATLSVGGLSLSSANAINDKLGHKQFAIKIVKGIVSYH